MREPSDVHPTARPMAILAVGALCVAVAIPVVLTSASACAPSAEETTGAARLSASELPTPTITLNSSQWKAHRGQVVSLSGAVSSPLGASGTVCLESMPGTSAAWAEAQRRHLATGSAPFSFSTTIAVSSLFRVLLRAPNDATAAVSPTASVARIPTVTIRPPARAVVGHVFTITGRVDPVWPGQDALGEYRLPGSHRGWAYLGRVVVGATGRYVLRAKPKSVGIWKIHVFSSSSPLSLGGTTRDVRVIVYRIRRRVGQRRPDPVTSF